MKRLLAVLIPTLLLLGPALAGAQPASAQPALATIRFGWCSRTLNSAVAPFAVAQKLGWFAQAGFKLEVIPMNGSIECTRNVATKEVPYAVASIEPVAMIRSQGGKVVNFYTAYQGNIYGLAVPEGSPIQTVADMRGKKIGVTSMASGGVLIARALVANAGMDPDKDVRIVVAGEGAQTAALLRSNQVDVLSLFDTVYALTMNAGAKLRFLDNSEIARFPSNGFIALEETLATRRAEAVGLARGYAMGTIFTMTNPEAAVRMLYEVYPQTRPTGKDEATAIADDIRTIEARTKNWKLEAGGVTRWGESSEKNYDDYIDFLVKWGVVKQKVAARTLVTNALLDEIDTFDPAAIVAQAKAYK